MIEPTQFSTGMAALVVTLAIAAWSDWTSWRLPNRLLGASAAVALLLAVVMPFGIGAGDCLLGGLAGLALFMPHYLLRGMAAGDVKLLGVVGMYTGPGMVLEIALATALVGGVWAIVLLVLRRKARSSEAQQTKLQLAGLPQRAAAFRRYQAIPYGVAMAIGTLFVMIT